MTFFHLKICPNLFGTTSAFTYEPKEAKKAESLLGCFLTLFRCFQCIRTSFQFQQKMRRVPVIIDDMFEFFSRACVTFPYMSTYFLETAKTNAALLNLWLCAIVSFNCFFLILHT